MLFAQLTMSSLRDTEGHWLLLAATQRTVSEIIKLTIEDEIFIIGFSPFSFNLTHELNPIPRF